MLNITQPVCKLRHFGATLLVFAVMAAPADAKQRDITPPPGPEVLTLDEAANLIRVRASALERLARRNEVPARRIAKQWRFNRRALLAWLNGDWKLITTAVPPQALALTPRAMGRIAGTGTSIAQSQTEPPPENAQEEDSPAPIGEAPKEKTAEEVFLRGRKVLLGPGEAAIDVGQFYSETDSQTVDGQSRLVTVETETFTTTFLGRVGILDETEIFAGTSFFNQDSDAYFGSRKTASAGRTAFGPVRLGIRHTLLKEGLGRPNVIATIDGSIPTGETSYAVGGGLAVVKSIDPVVLFANASYRHTFSRDFSDASRLEAKDRIDASVGYALALNDTLTLSTSVAGAFARAAQFTAAELRQTDSYSLQFGLTSWLAKGLYIEPSVSFGLGGPSDSFAFGITIPYSFPP